MLEQSAIEWLKEQYNMRGETLPSGVFQEAKEMEYRQFGVFLNWVIKHYSTTIIDGMFAWINSMGEEVSIKEILDHYYSYGKE